PVTDLDLCQSGSWSDDLGRVNVVMNLETNAHIDAATEAALRLFTERIEGKYNVAGLILFGSRARGDHARHSDADVAVLLRGRHKRLLPTKLAMADDAFDVLLEIGIRIQPLPIWAAVPNLKA
ncbi:nucleotidyltransferase domain-containing protein, partial [Thiococcus pfennigii]